MQASLPAIRLRISYEFWIMALLPGITGGLEGMMTWGATIFGSVVLHELGHAIFGLSIGHRAVIVLHRLGGRVEFEPPLSARRAMGSTLAAALPSLLAGALLLGVRRALPSTPIWLSIAAGVNLGWGVLNLLPIIPFDGGRLLVAQLGKRRATTALLISTVTTAVALTVCIATVRNPGFMILLMTVCALSLFEVAKVHDLVRTQLMDTQLGAARLAVLQHRYGDAIRVSEATLGQARDFDTRNAALTMLAWACLGEGRPRAAMAALQKVLPREAVDPYTLAATQRALGHIDDAIQTLEGLRKAASLSRAPARLLIDLYAERGDLQLAFATTLDLLRVLGPEDARRVVDSLEQAKEFGNAAALREAIGKTAHFT